MHFGAVIMEFRVVLVFREIPSVFRIAEDFGL